jgi:branched-subunit amino acid ABC-type transport system permease component
MKNLKILILFVFPLLIILFGLIIYKVLEFEPNMYTIVINLGLAFILSPSIKTVQKQHGEEEQIKWLFFKKVINKKI